MIPAIKYRNTQDLALTVLQTSVSDAFQALAAIPFLDGVLLQDVALTTSSQDIEHKLGRAWRGYFVGKNSANAVVYTGTGTNSTSLFVSLRASASTTVDLWVY